MGKYFTCTAVSGWSKYRNVSYSTNPKESTLCLSLPEYNSAPVAIKYELPKEVAGIKVYRKKRDKDLSCLGKYFAIVTYNDGTELCYPFSSVSGKHTDHWVRTASCGLRNGQKSTLVESGNCSYDHTYPTEDEMSVDFLRGIFLYATCEYTRIAHADWWREMN